MSARTLELLRRLSLAAGPPGAEDEVREIVRETLQATGAIAFDRLGSLVCERRGRAERPRVWLDSHLDEVGFMVQSVSDEGMLAFVPLGGWWGHVLLGQRVDVLTDDGVVPGVIGSKPPHFLGPEERKQVLPLDAMYIDVGAGSRGQVAALGIRIGDPVVPHADFVDMGIDDVVSGKAFDDRVGVALMCETLLDLDGEHPNTVVGVGAVQEELGGRGARTVAELARADVALVLECTPADDLPGRRECQARLGGGPQVRHFDPTSVANRRLVRLVEEAAGDLGIDVQMAVRRSGGTDAAEIQRFGAGVPAVVIGVPARYIHSHVSLLNLADYRSARALVAELLGRLDDTAVDRLTAFD